MEHILINGIVHTGYKQHQRVCTQICMQMCLSVLCERALTEWRQNMYQINSEDIKIIRF